ncbi:hypothetical protein M758_4G023200 [Ceratodon purpureus]|nr:hypothetical protein M758_4G023200 [Ceratodon purpureus]
MDNCYNKVIDQSDLTTECQFSEYHTAAADDVCCGPAVSYDTAASCSVDAITSTEYLSAHHDDMVESTKRTLTELEREIEASKVHWSENSSNSMDSDDDEGEKESNQQIYEKLRKLPKYQQWLNIYGVQSGKAIVFGPKLAEGGQAEIFEADDCSKSLGSHFSYVLKVYKKGYSLKGLKSQWPDGVLSSHKYIVTGVQGGMVLEDDRFAFLLKRCDIDLWKIIEIAKENNSPLWKDNGRPLKEFRGYNTTRSGRRPGCCMPVFSDECAQSIMLKIACDMLLLHTINVLHRDLKTSNILCNDFNVDQIGRTRRITMHLADYESSIGVSGTGFWRAPEILQQVKEEKSRIEFTKEADVYAYAMTCYEILTGCTPFEGRKGVQYDDVLNGERPPLPDYIPAWVKDLLRRCWHQNPSERPTFRVIPEEIKAHGTQLYSVVLEEPNKAKPSWISKMLHYSTM